MFPWNACCVFALVLQPVLAFRDGKATTLSSLLPSPSEAGKLIQNETAELKKELRMISEHVDAIDEMAKDLEVPGLKDADYQQAFQQVYGMDTSEAIKLLEERQRHNQRLTDLIYDLSKLKKWGIKQIHVNATGKSGRTPLFMVCEEGSLKLAKLLIEKGADVEAKDWFTWTPLQSAAAYGHAPIVELLLEHGADLEHYNSAVVNALSAAACGGHDKVVEVLLKHGANPSAKFGRGISGKSALSAASSNGHSKVVELLKAAGAKE